MIRSSSFKRALLAGGFLLAGAGVSFADYNAGTAAFNAGDYTRAFQEYRQSAHAGNSLAQYMMGRLYAEGRGVGEDKLTAYMWFDLSASNGNSRAITARDAIAAEMDADEIERAQQMAADWRASRPAIATAQTTPAATPATAPYSLRNVQVALGQLGYSVGTPDGVIGPKSRAAIRAFQTDSGLPASGEPSLALYDKLQEAIAKRTAQAQPAQPAAPTVNAAMITEAQTELRRRGYQIQRDHRNRQHRNRRGRARVPDRCAHVGDRHDQRGAAQATSHRQGGQRRHLSRAGQAGAGGAQCGRLQCGAAGRRAGPEKPGRHRALSVGQRTAGHGRH